MPALNYVIWVNKCYQKSPINFTEKISYFVVNIVAADDLALI